jgi:hypothetical protein
MTKSFYPARVLNCKRVSVVERDPQYWDRRREWLREEARRQGCDWNGVLETYCDVAAFLADLRRRGQS